MEAKENNLVLHNRNNRDLFSLLEIGLSESDILSRLQKKLDVSLQVAQEYLAMFGK